MVGVTAALTLRLNLGTTMPNALTMYVYEQSEYEVHQILTPHLSLTLTLTLLDLNPDLNINTNRNAEPTDKQPSIM